MSYLGGDAYELRGGRCHAKDNDQCKKYDEFFRNCGDFSKPIKDILFPSIYNTRIIINNTELIIIRVAL